MGGLRCWALVLVEWFWRFITRYDLMELMLYCFELIKEGLCSLFFKV